MDNHRLVFKTSQNKNMCTSKNIKDLQINEYASVIVLIQSHLEPIKSKGTDYVTTINVVDELGSFLEVKMFTRTPKFANYFKEQDIIKIPSVKANSDGKAVTGHGSNIEVLANANSEETLVFLTNSEKDRVQKLKDFAKKYKTVSPWPTWTIEEIREHSYFAFKGTLLTIKYERPDLTLLSFIDYTKNNTLDDVMNNTEFDNSMTLYVKIWGAQIQKNLTHLKIGETYLLRRLKTEKLGMVLEATISESFYVPLTLVDHNSKYYKAIMTAKTKFYNLKQNALDEEKNSKIQKQYGLFKPSKINEIKMAGVYKIEIEIILHYPFTPIDVTTCTKCKSIESEDYTFKNNNLCKKLTNCNPIQEKILRIQVRDTTGFCCILLKNKLVDQFLSSDENLRKKNLKCIVSFNDDAFLMLDADF